MSPGSKRPEVARPRYAMHPDDAPAASARLHKTAPKRTNADDAPCVLHAWCISAPTTSDDSCHVWPGARSARLARLTLFHGPMQMHVAFATSTHTVLQFRRRDVTRSLVRECRRGAAVVTQCRRIWARSEERTRWAGRRTRTDSRTRRLCESRRHRGGYYLVAAEGARGTLRGLPTLRAVCCASARRRARCPSRFRVLAQP